MSPLCTLTRIKHSRHYQKMVGFTRSAISRLMTEAREKGIVEIKVHYHYRTNFELEKALVDGFGIKAAFVLVREDKSVEEMVQGLGVLAAQYFSSIVTPKSIIGITWGTNLYQMVQAIKYKSLPDAEVVQLVGGTGTEKGSAIGPLLAPMLADRLGCACRFLNVPLVTQSAEIRKALLNEPTVREALDRANHADIAYPLYARLFKDLFHGRGIVHFVGQVLGRKVQELVDPCPPARAFAHIVNDPLVGDVYHAKKVWAWDTWHLTSRCLRKLVSHLFAVFLVRVSDFRQ
jgi:hypothetical protein